MQFTNVLVGYMISLMATSSQVNEVSAWSSAGFLLLSRSHHRSNRFIARTSPTIPNRRVHTQHQEGALFVSEQQAEPPAVSSDEEEEDPKTPSSNFSDDELQLIQTIFGASLLQDATALRDTLMGALPTMSPNLIIKLKTAQEDADERVRAVAASLSLIMDAQLELARDMLASLLSAGEIRKLDALIGQAARDGKLDAAFFTVLNMNLQDARQQEQYEVTFSTDTDDDNKDDSDDDSEKDSAGPAASRVQILSHVYTRCQEEVEKTVPPGIALLNKLLRTEVDSIRANQLDHYLCPQPNTVTTPDGKTVELKGEPRILVPPLDLVDALAQAVKQIRSVEKAGGTDRASAAGMVESCRQVAKEARMVIGEKYGPDSDVTLDFEAGLQPVFRPDSSDSPYIKGE